MTSADSSNPDTPVSAPKDAAPRARSAEAHSTPVGATRSGVADAFLFNKPFALFLTHRRGGAVMLFNPALSEKNSASVVMPAAAQELFIQLCQELTASEDLKIFAQNHETLRSLFISLWNLQELATLGKRDNALQQETYVNRHGAVVLGLSQTTTAEHLARLYQDCLQQASLSDAELGRLVMGVGPGSFTGLRLGCAFANGLAFGRARSELWKVPCAQLVRLLQCYERAHLSHSLPFLMPASEPTAGLACSSAVPWLAGTDEFGALVSVADVMAACFFLLDPELARPEEQSFVPAYGKEPTPVVKLRDKEQSPPSAT